jgi:hypothetical protein
MGACDLQLELRACQDENKIYLVKDNATQVEEQYKDWRDKFV